MAHHKYNCLLCTVYRADITYLRASIVYTMYYFQATFCVLCRQYRRRCRCGSAPPQSPESPHAPRLPTSVRRLPRTWIFYQSSPPSQLDPTRTSSRPSNGVTSIPSTLSPLAPSKSQNAPMCLPPTSADSPRRSSTRCTAMSDSRVT